MTKPRRTLVAMTVAIAASLTLSAVPARGQYRETSTVDESTIVFYEVMSIPEDGIPPALLEGAQAVAIIPRVLKAGFLGGVRFGRGVLLVRTTDGGWSNPVFVTLTGGSFGLQAGAQATDLILVFKNRGSLDSFFSGRGKFTLGADAAVAAGPIGRQVEAGTDALLSSEILSYSRSRGLFAGVSLEGAALSLDWRSNVAYYGEVIGPSDILTGAEIAVPKSAARLKGWLNYYTKPRMMP
jgi:lipid-binding SYLF domain-containing protein